MGKKKKKKKQLCIECNCILHPQTIKLGKDICGVCEDEKYFKRNKKSQRTLAKEAEQKIIDIIKQRQTDPKPSNFKKANPVNNYNPSLTGIFQSCKYCGIQVDNSLLTNHMSNCVHNPLQR